MNESLFLQYVQRFFPGLVVSATERLNNNAYLHKTMLQPVYSPTLKWDALSKNNALVAADVVAMDAAIPLKKRPTISRASGDIPKLGMELKLNEQQLTNLDILSRTQGQQEQFLLSLFEDTPKVIGGVYERCEHMFLEALSTGVTLIEDNENVGTGIRIDFGIPTTNKFGVSVLWANTGAKPFSDIERAVTAAQGNGDNITLVMLDRAAFNNLAKSDEAKAYYSASIGATTSVTPTLSQLNVAAQDRYGFQFQIVDRAIKVEKNGVQTNVKPWATGQVALLTSNQVGSLTYGTLAEMNHPVANVTYETADSYILVSKYRKNEPSLSEHTRSQALVVPVLNNVNQIYLLDSLTVQA